MKQQVTLALSLTLAAGLLAGCADTTGGSQPTGAAQTSPADATPSAARSAAFTDEMKIPHAVDLSPEDGADSVERLGDHAHSPYFAHPDYYHMQSSDTLTILTGFQTMQQTSEWACGVTSTLMVLNWYDRLGYWNEESLAALRHSLEGTGLAGYPGTTLRQAIARDLREYKGMAVPPEQIVVGAGAEYLYLLLAQLLGREAVFAVEDPGYPKIRQVYGKCGAACRPVPLDGQGVPPEALEAAGASVVHLSPAHHYPTGLVTPIGRRQALLRWAEKAGGIIIEDDYDSEFRFTGRPIPTLQSIDTAGRVVYMNTFSQTISPSMRVGFMVLPPRLLEQYRRELDFYSCTVPALDQHVLARFLDQGHYEQHLARMRKEYRTRHDAVLASFRSSPFRNRITISEQGAGLHFLLRLDTRESDGALRDRAAALGVRLGFLSEYAAIPSPAYAHTLVVNYAGLSPAALPEAMDLLAEIFGA
mgnify:CR=1 FL=1